MIQGPNEGNHNGDDRSNSSAGTEAGKDVCERDSESESLLRGSDTDESVREFFGSIRSFSRERPDSDSDSDSDQNNDSSEDRRADDATDSAESPHEKRMSKWRRMARGQWERMLLENIVNTGELRHALQNSTIGLTILRQDSIRPNYEDIFVDPLTIQKLENVTSLSLRRPKAFNHGVLRSNRITGSILYGPPGTGKSLLCRGLAKQSGLNMLAVSAAEIWQKCWGDDEKVIKAIFSLARKIYPCIVFIDEADAMLGARKGGEKRHIRSMINQFLMEWDGLALDLKAPFILLATNRPFDLDPAVLRRAPVQIHMDLPTTSERLGILHLLLKGETLAPDIDVLALAKMTPRFSGSDLKSLCVQAALECICEQPGDTDVRVVERRHFMSAFQTIRATGMTKTMANQFDIFGKHARNLEPGEEE